MPNRGSWQFHWFTTFCLIFPILSSQLGGCPLVIPWLFSYPLGLLVFQHVLCKFPFHLSRLLHNSLCVLSLLCVLAPSVSLIWGIPLALPRMQTVQRQNPLLSLPLSLLASLYLIFIYIPPLSLAASLSLSNQTSVPNLRFSHKNSIAIWVQQIDDSSH